MANEEEEPVPVNDDEQAASNIVAEPQLQRVENSTEIVEVTSPSQPQRQQDLVLDIPSRTIEDAEEGFVRIDMPLTPTTSRRVNFSPMPSPPFGKMNDFPGPFSSKNKTTFKSLLPKLSFKYRNTTLDIEKAAILALGSSFAETREKPRITRASSFTKLFTPKMKKTSSFPVTPVSHSNPESTHGEPTTDLLNSAKGAQLPIHRSRSVPLLNKDGAIKQMDSLGGVFRVIPTTPRVAEGSGTTSSHTFPSNTTDKKVDGGEDIPEEEAICRICFIELGEGSDTLKMECSCKGELSFAHRECAVKWFSIKGNKTCEVCKQEVKNLPVTLLRLQNVQAGSLRDSGAQVTRYRVWQDVPILVIVSMLAYFCFLEQLLVGKMKSGAIAISLPFSCILGILASMTATTMVRKNYIWLYAFIQFGLVVLSAHLFYSLLHMQAVIVVLLSAFAGFGITMAGTSILVESLWRRRWVAQSRQQPVTWELTQPDQLSSITRQTPSESLHRESEIRDSESAQGS